MIPGDLGHMLNFNITLRFQWRRPVFPDSVFLMTMLTTNEFTVKNSFNFADEIVDYDHNLYIASLGVDSLFTNIPLKETIKNCVKDLFPIIFIVVN